MGKGPVPGKTDPGIREPTELPDLSLDLRYLRYVLAVVEQGSFRQAASKLDVPQSTISRRVAQLEGRLGVPIFNRDHSGVRLTSAGERFVNEALLGAQHFTNAVGAMHATRAGRGGSLRIGMFTSLRNEFLRTLVGEYHRKYPQIECHFTEGTTQTLVGGVVDGRIDIAFVTGEPAVPRCHTTVLGEESLFAAMQKTKMSGSRQAAIELESLRGQRFIVTRGGRGPEIEDFLVACLATPAFRPNIQVHDVSFDTLLHMVELGMGVAIVTKAATALDDSIVFRTLAGVDAKVKSSVVWLISNANPALRPLADLARQLTR